MSKKGQADAPSIIMYYLNWVDEPSHHKGVPEDENSTNSVVTVPFFNGLKAVDDFVGLSWKKINELDLADRVNFIILSDHGMTNVNENRTIWLKDHLAEYAKQNTSSTFVDVTSPGTVINLTYGTLVDLYVMPKSTDANLKRQTTLLLYENIKNTISMFSLQCTAYLREEIPERYHYRNNVRIPDILIVSNIGWYTGMDSSAWWGEQG